MPNDRIYYEIVNDKDGFVANAWRAIQFAPDETAKYCDWPVNHADLIARRKVLIANEERLLENLCADPEWYDAKIAGYWIWGMSVWIGAGLTRPGAMPEVSANKGVTTASGGIPILAHDQHGLMQERQKAGGKRPQLTNNKGVTCASRGGIPILAHDQHGLMQERQKAGGKIPHMKDDTGVINKSDIYDWFARLSNRLRNVKVVCGDFMRVLGGNWQSKGCNCGIFFDPPYGVADRADCYHHDSRTVAYEVMEYCIKRGNDNDYRIVLAGYEEYQELIDNHGWTGENWSAAGGYANMGKEKNENRHREMLYFSPHCLRETLPLFEQEERK